MAWAPEDIKTGLAKREADERRRDEERVEGIRRSERARANATCIHCGNPFVSYTTTEFPLCDQCQGED